MTEQTSNDIKDVAGIFRNLSRCDLSRRDFFRLDGAGHWVQHEQPAQVSALLLQFLRDQSPGAGKL
jgi:pimeloyl-ACP methyl ester carboxylesterase